MMLQSIRSKYIKCRVKVIKTSNHVYLRLEAVSATGIVMWTNVLTNSSTPGNTDESVGYSMARADQLLGKQGNLIRLLEGLPDFFMVHLCDNGFK